MRLETKGTRQLVREAVAAADRATLWGILVDSRSLPEWAAPVREVDSCAAGGEAVGALRRCSVELGGRSGTMVERCVGLEPLRRIAFAVEEESFGMRRMFADYSFSISLTAVADGRTRVTIETFYTPRNPVYALLNRLALRRLYRRTVDQLLAGLVRLAEQRSQPSASPAATA